MAVKSNSTTSKTAAPRAARKPAASRGGSAASNGKVSFGAITLSKPKVAAALKPMVPAVHEFTSFADAEGNMELLAYAREFKQDTLIMGPTGVGKTHMARAFAAALGAPYWRFPANESTDEAAFVGQKVLNNRGGMEFEPGMIAAWAEQGGVMLIDEYNQAHADARIVLAPVHYSDEARLIVVPDGHRVINRHEDSILIATANPYEYGGTKEMGAQLMSRFGVVIELDYLPAERETELLLGEVDIDPDLGEKMVNAANSVRSARNDDRIQFPMSYREIKTWAHMAMTFGIAMSANVAVLNKITDPLERDGVRTLLSANFAENEWV
jgi:hypothetical protein